jgi:allantoinase
MPLNSVPPTTTLAGLEAKLQAAVGSAWIDYGLWGGAVPGNADALPSLLDAGVLGFKAFLVPSGVKEFPPLGEDDLRAALGVLAPLDAPLLVHAEDPGRLDPSPLARDPASHASWLASRPAEAESCAIDALIGMVEETDARAHVVHVSASPSVDSIARARRRGFAISAETCPHYLFFDAEDIPSRELRFKCAPPIREATHRERLWEGLRVGTLDLVASDHSPCPPSMKLGDFATAWGGIASLQLSLAVTWTAARERGFSPDDLARWMSAAPARLAGIERRKGAIAPGLDADLVIWDPDANFEVRPEDLHHRHRETPYVGARLAGRVQTTFVRGRRVYDTGSFCDRPLGGWIRGREGA